MTQTLATSWNALSRSPAASAAAIEARTSPTSVNVAERDRAPAVGEIDGGGRDQQRREPSRGRRVAQRGGAQRRRQRGHGRRDGRAPARRGGQRHEQDEHDRERVDVAPVGVVGGALQREREQAQHDAGGGQREVGDRRRSDGVGDAHRGHPLSPRPRCPHHKGPGRLPLRPPSMTPIGRCARGACGAGWMDPTEGAAHEPASPYIPAPPPNQPTARHGAPRRRRSRLRARRRAGARARRRHAVDGPRDVHRDHGAVGLREVDVAAARRGPGPADAGPRPPRRAASSAGSTSGRSPGCAASGSASSSSPSTCSAR